MSKKKSFFFFFRRIMVHDRVKHYGLKLQDTKKITGQFLFIFCLYHIACYEQNLDDFTSFFLSIQICHFFLILLLFYQYLLYSFYYPVHYPSFYQLFFSSLCPTFFFSAETIQVGRIVLSLLQLHAVVLCSSLFLFPAQFICFVIQLL